MFLRVCRILFIKPTFLFFLFSAVAIFLIGLHFVYYPASEIALVALMGVAIMVFGFVEIFGTKDKLTMWATRISTILMLAFVSIYVTLDVYLIRGQVGCKDQFYLGELSRDNVKLGTINGSACNFFDLYRYWLSDRVRWREVAIPEHWPHFEGQVLTKLDQETVCIKANIYWEVRSSASHNLHKTFTDTGSIPTVSLTKLWALAKKALDTEAASTPPDLRRLRKCLESIEDEVYEIERIKIQTIIDGDEIELDD